METFFLEDVMSGEEQTAVEYGLLVKRKYDTEKCSYYITDIREADSGKCLLDFDDNSRIWFDGTYYIFEKNYNDQKMYYYEEGTSEKRSLDFYNKEMYNRSTLYNSYLTTEGEDIVGLLTIAKRAGHGSWSLVQEDIAKEILFKLNPVTGEESILYDTGNSKTRIMGYKDGRIYLLKDYTVYGEELPDGEREELFTFPEIGHTFYNFAWVDNVFIVWTEKGLLTEYVVE